MINRRDNPATRTIVMFAVFTVVLLWLIMVGKEVYAERLQVGISRDIKTALIRLADRKGFFNARGLDVLLSEYESGAQAVKNLVKDNLEMATAAEFVFVLQSARHPDLRIPATICRSSDNDLIVRKDLDIAGPETLKGRRIGVPPGTSAEFFLHSYLVFKRIPPETVEIVHKSPSELVKAMADGTIDAALCWPPFTLEMQRKLGTRSACWPAQSGQDYYFTLFAKEGFLKQHASETEKFISALSQAESFLAKDPERAMHILGKELNLDADSLSFQWSRSNIGLQLTQDLLVLMEREIKWAIRKGLVDKSAIPNYLEFLYFDAIDKVKPEAASVVH